MSLKPATTCGTESTRQITGSIGVRARNGTILRRCVRSPEETLLSIKLTQHTDVDFNTAQKKLDPSQVQAANDAKKKTDATAAAISAAGSGAAATANTTNVATVATQGTNPDGTPAPPPAAAASGAPYPSFMGHMAGLAMGPAISMIAGPAPAIAQT